MTPLTPEAREMFAAYLTVLKRGAVDQGRDRRERAEHQPVLAAAVHPTGTDAAAPAYVALLARSYDAIKAVDPRRASGAARSRRAASTGEHGP